MKTLEQLEEERFAWSLETFPEATKFSSMVKMQGEAQEVMLELVYGSTEGNLTEEYADCLMCLFDSAGRAGISVAMLRDAFEKKLAKNKARTWKKNPDNTYSHVKNS